MSGDFRINEWNGGSLSLPTAIPYPPATVLELPTGQVPLNSPFYVERPPSEAYSREELKKAGALIRIKAPVRSGKTSLMTRILAAGREYGYHTIALNFQLATSSVFASVDRFLQWFCASVGKSLGLPNRVAEYWDEIFGSNYNCTDYFENYLLPACNTPVVLALDDADRVFQHPEIASEFFGLLRTWYEKAKYGDRSSESFEKLRLVIVHTAEIYTLLQINQSPFNVGLALELPEFSEFQVRDLALRHGLNLSDRQIEEFMALLGGNPYLVRVALYALKCQDLSFDKLLKTAATEGGIYREHLRRQWRHLQQQPELAEAFDRAVVSEMPVELEAKQAFQLQSMGLVRLFGSEATPSCELYRQYFRCSLNQWKQSSESGCIARYRERIAKLERDNLKLQQLVKVDSLTQLANRRFFDHYLNAEWQRLALVKAPLSLILCDIDFFKAYNDTYGHPAGDQCLQKVAKAIAEVTKFHVNLAARYGGEEFALILPDTSGEEALLIAEAIRSAVKQLEIPHSQSKVGTSVSLSMGVASTVPRMEWSPNNIVRVADKALYEAKSQGRDRTVLKLLI